MEAFDAANILKLKGGFAQLADHQRQANEALKALEDAREDADPTLKLMRASLEMLANRVAALEQNVIRMLEDHYPG